IPTIDRYVLPLDSSDKTENDFLRAHSRSHFDVIQNRLETLKSAGKTVTLSTTITAANAFSLPGIARFLKGYVRSGGKVHAWHLYRFIPEGRGGRVNASRLGLSEFTYTQACKAATSLFLPFPVYRRKNMYRSSSVDFFWRLKGQWVNAHQDRRLPQGNRAGSSLIMISR
ncbi:MAG: hypothetical protein Q7T11_03250, partial [Deltaproteobacteria bacterium]|nr:hypothetical protein [Deltaproteobacteria bacterium]